ncbi:hypothetical protein QUA43_05200 [Microcoleus sp. N9_B4]
MPHYPMPYALCPIFISYAATRNIHFTFLEIADDRIDRTCEKFDRQFPT